MRCPYCGHLDSRVTDSRDSADGIRRRRECLRCGSRFTTYERAHTGGLMVVKRDDRREEFSREKLLTGVRLACAKRPLPTGIIEKLVDDIEAQLQGLGRAEVESYVIGEAVMERLKHLDRVAYIRFASVYRDFKDAESFRDELEALEHGEERGPGAQLPLLPLGPPPLQRHPRRGRRPGSVGRKADNGEQSNGVK